MSECAGQFTTVKYADEFNNASARENMSPPVTSKLPAATVKFDPEISIQKPSIRGNSVKAPASSQYSQPQKYFNGLTDKQKAEAYFAA